MTTTFKTAAMIAIPLLAACAPNPASIAPVPMHGAFAAMDCRQAALTLTAERANLDALTVKQRGAATGDAVSVFLIGVPTSGLTGNNVAGELGAAKGKVAALEARIASCG